MGEVKILDDEIIKQSESDLNWLFAILDAIGKKIEEEERGKGVAIVDDSLLEKQSKTFLVYDSGLALDHALALASRGNKVYYFVEWRARNTKLEEHIVGYGYNQIEKILDYGTVYKNVDAVIFTDCSFGAIADKMRSEGVNVFGTSLLGSKLEIDRNFMLDELSKLGIKVPSYQVVMGVDELLKKKVDGKKQVIKVDNIYRSNFETTVVETVDELKIALEEARFGVMKNSMKFIITEFVEGVEIGVDAFFNGKHFLRPYHFGNETKGSNGTFGKWVNESIWDSVFSKLEPWLEKAGYRGSISLEGIWDGKDITVLDVTARFPYPCGSVYGICIENYDDVILAVARGEDIDIKLKTGIYTAQLSFEREDLNSWVKVEQKEPSDKIVYPIGSIIVDGQNWIVPGEKIVAVVVGTGNSYEEARDDAIREKDKVSIKGAEFSWDAIIRYEKDYLPKYKEMGNIW